MGKITKENFLTNKLNKNEDICFDFCIKSVKEFSAKDNECFKNCLKKVINGMDFLIKHENLNWNKN